MLGTKYESHRRFTSRRNGSLERLETRVLLAGDTIRINFQTDNTIDVGQYPELEGYVADSGQAFGARGNGLAYGWLDGSLNPDAQAQARNRGNGSSPDERYDTLNHFIKGDNHSWRIALANGPYEIKLVAGDPSHTDQISDFFLISGGETLQLDDPDGPDNWDEFTIPEFNVNAGRMRITPNASGSNQKIAFIELTPLEQTQPEPPVVGNIAATEVGPFTASVGGRIVDDGNDPPSVTIYFGDNDAATNIQGWDQAINVGPQDGDYSTVVTDLLPNTQYFYRSLAVNRGGFVWTDTASFSTASIAPAPVVNRPATEVSAFAGVIGGSVVATGHDTPSVSIFWGDDDAGLDVASWDNEIMLGEQPGEFSAAIDNLIHNTTYFYRSRTTNLGGTEWAPSASSFTTLNVTAPVIGSQNAIDIEAFQALLTGQITNIGNDAPQVTLFWGDNDGGTNPAAWDQIQELGNINSFFSSTVTNLRHDSDYFFRVRATNAGGTTWANSSAQFRTLRVTLASVMNDPAIQIGSSSADLGGTVTDFGNDAPQIRIYYGRTDGGTSVDAWENVLDGGIEFGSFSEQANQLDPDTIYFFRALATNFAGASWAPASSSFRTAEAPQLLITEFLAANASNITTKLRPASGEPFGPSLSPDWIEIHNPTSQSVDIGGILLSDNSDDPAKWAFPPGTSIPANGYLVVFASGEDVPDATLDERGFLHTNFRLSTDGEYLGLAQSDGTPIHSYAPFPNQRADISYGIDEQGQEHYYSGITRGAANNAGIINLVGDTSFSEDRGFYDSPFELVISSTTPGATIVYTLDGSQPTATHGTRIAPANAESDPAATIPISKTTMVRAFALKSGFESTNVDTHTYLFPADILTQATDPSNGRQVTPDGYPARWGNETGDYQVDPDIVDHRTESDRIVADDLKSVGSISIVMDREDLFGDNQIYLSGSGRPRSASIELISGDGQEEFQIDGSVQIQGGSSTNRWKDFKLSMRLKFQEPFGPTKLSHSLYEDSPIDRYDNIILDGVLNHSWLHSGQHNMPQYIQDQYVADLHNAMEGYSPYGRFMHVYLNGLYWGMYYVHDRPDHAWAAELFGGEKEEYHAIKHDANQVINNGNGESARFSYNQMVDAARDVSRDTDNLQKWETLTQQLDVDNFITYLLANWFTGNHDWPQKNWYATAPDGGPWRFHSWDAEHATDSDNDVGDSPTGLHALLDGSDEYMIRMADLIHKHFYNAGVLTPDSAAELWQNRMTEIDRAIVGESARWGDNRSSRAHTRTEWLNYNGERGLLGNYFPGRTDRVLSQLRSASIYPRLDAPEFGQHGGRIDAGTSVTISNPDNQGTVFYTTDGSDPRQVGGARNPAAIASGGGVALSRTTTLKARILDGTTWSALTAATFYVNAPLPGELVVSEINYNPHAPLTQFGEALVDPDRFEFIELHNRSDHPIDLTGVQLVDTVSNGERDGVRFDFASQILGAGERLVVAGNEAAFATRYPNVPLAMSTAPTSNEFDGRLRNGGERLTLLSADGQVLQQFRFNDSGQWPGRADGRGSTLELVPSFDPTVDSPGSQSSWRSSSEFGGSPGTAGEGPTDDVVINELLTHTDLPQVDRIELRNNTGQPIDVSNWYVSDSGTDYFRFRLPAVANVISANGYLTLDENQLGFGFRGEQSDDAWLIAADGNGKPTRFMDHVSFGAAQNGVALGRWPDGSGRLFPMESPSLGATNLAPALADVIISEVHFNPAAAEMGISLAVDELEFVEVWNSDGAPANLGHWRLNKAVDFSFPANTILGPNTGLVVVAFDPNDVEKVNQFKLNYGLDSSVQVFGPYSGALDNGGENLELDRPEDIQKLGLGYVLIDRVVYDDQQPWPTSTDGFGNSLHRLSPSDYGDFSSSWKALSPSPGTAEFVSIDPDLDGNGDVNASDIDFLCSRIRAVDSAFDMNGDANINQNDLAFFVRNILRSNFGDATLDNVFDSSDLIRIFQTGHYEDGVDDNSGWATGDWNCDQDFDTSDLVIAFQAGGYVSAARPISASGHVLLDDSAKIAGRILNSDGDPSKKNLPAKLDNEVPQDSKRGIELELAIHDQLFAG